MGLTIPKQKVQGYSKLFEDLDIACSKSHALEGAKPTRAYIYELNDFERGTYVAAIQEYGRVHAVVTPHDQRDEDMVVYEFIFRELKGNDILLVFTDRDEEFARKYAYSDEHRARIKR